MIKISFYTEFQNSYNLIIYKNRDLFLKYL